MGPMEGAPMRTGLRQAAAFITRQTAMYACPDHVHARRTCNLVLGNIVLTPASLGEGAQGLRFHMQIKLCTVHRGGMHCKTSS